MDDQLLTYTHRLHPYICTVNRCCLYVDWWQAAQLHISQVVTSSYIITIVGIIIITYIRIIMILMVIVHFNSVERSAYRQVTHRDRRTYTWLHHSLMLMFVCEEVIGRMVHTTRRITTIRLLTSGDVTDEAAAHVPIARIDHNKQSRLISISVIEWNESIRSISRTRVYRHRNTTDKVRY